MAAGSNFLPREKLNFNSEKIEQGLAKLVLTVIELLRQLVERQALRRVEGGSLSDQQIEDLGVTLMQLEEKMEELKSAFNLEGEDLNIDLGPLGNLL
ncbi:gas vesicle protein K [Alkalihalobacterium elongatum]|uniref:gas vesicle protein K n=1 Tax=Alkalihalobacterium elongatum TaxID=2675466 RepID=UPI001C1F2341|nr:gas vesicle protein K [Alkalihalobacterium elongatum]